MAEYFYEENIFIFISSFFVAQFSIANTTIACLLDGVQTYAKNGYEEKISLQQTITFDDSSVINFSNEHLTDTSNSEGFITNYANENGKLNFESSVTDTNIEVSLNLKEGYKMFPDHGVYYYSFTLSINRLTGIANVSSSTATWFQPSNENEKEINRHKYSAFGNCSSQEKKF
jgi:hypothetical protein